MVEYSERHHVPTVQSYQKEEAERIKQAEAAKAASKPPSVPPKDESEGQSGGGGQAEKERIKAQMAPKGKPAAGFQAQGERWVISFTIKSKDCC